MKTLPNKRYSIVYADPPWRYRNYDYAYTSDGRRARRGCAKEYEVQDIGWIRSLPVSEIVAEDAVLFLWVTWPLLVEGISVIGAWGFEYKTVGFVWVKENGGRLFWGMGNWTRSNTEACLIGVRGKIRRVDAGVHSVIKAPVGRHSSKPIEVRDRIVRLMGDLPRIELFARERVEGWDAWGNEL